ncbi:hypothetical protein FRC10_004488, partial [Ceratobasidium sp. 414]
MDEREDDESEAPPPEDPSRAGTPAQGGANGEDEGDVTLTKRQRSQLHTFGEDAGALVDWVMEHVWVEMAVTCPFPELQGLSGADDQCYLDIWVTKLWANAHAELHPNSPRLQLHDHHITYLSPTRNVMKKACDGLLSMYYGLHRSDSNHKVKATEITHDEKWLSL